MHELGLMTSVMEAVQASAAEAHATSVTQINLVVGEMTEVVREALDFAFEALSEGTICEGAKLEVRIVKPRSVCLDCGEEFSHDRFCRLCAKCGSAATQLVAGRELHIDSIEIMEDD